MRGAQPMTGRARPSACDAWRGHRCGWWAAGRMAPPRCRRRWRRSGHMNCGLPAVPSSCAWWPKVPPICIRAWGPLPSGISLPGRPWVKLLRTVVRIADGQALQYNTRDELLNPDSGLWLIRALQALAARLTSARHPRGSTRNTHRAQLLGTQCAEAAIYRHGSGHAQSIDRHRPPLAREPDPRRSPAQAVTTTAESTTCGVSPPPPACRHCQLHGARHVAGRIAWKIQHPRLRHRLLPDGTLGRCRVLVILQRTGNVAAGTGHIARYSEAGAVGAAPMLRVSHSAPSVGLPSRYCATTGAQP